TLVAAVTIIGMQSVGLLLVVATLITPAAAGRFWTDDIRRLALIAGGLGAGSAVIGIVISAVFPRVAAGATIVLVAGVLFAISMLLGRRRGVLWRRWEHRRLDQQVARDDLIRAIYVQTEMRGATDEQAAPVSRAAVLAARSWSARHVDRLIRWAVSAGLVSHVGTNELRLTDAGLASGRRLVRNHRLWELYLIQYADIAAVHVDHTADLIEHIVDPGIVAELEQILEQRDLGDKVPASPHAIAGAS
ncbi:MAG: metal ABC transporter permease, partial [Planctomycetaceae bacterium]|nr:metal ABC transporter permease [Planctomycetaceae bacterium]